jgi:hypothetical protein
VGVVRTTTNCGPDKKRKAGVGVPTRTVKILALMVAFLSGVVGGLLSFGVVFHLSGETLKSLASASAAFLSVTLLVKEVEEKLGLL